MSKDSHFTGQPVYSQVLNPNPIERFGLILLNEGFLEKYEWCFQELFVSLTSISHTESRYGLKCVEYGNQFFCKTHNKNFYESTFFRERHKSVATLK